MNIKTTIELDTHESNSLLDAETVLQDICNNFTACNNCPFESEFETCPHEVLRQAIDLLTEKR